MKNLTLYKAYTNFEYSSVVLVLSVGLPKNAHAHGLNIAVLYIHSTGIKYIYNLTVRWFTINNFIKL